MIDYRETDFGHSQELIQFLKEDLNQVALDSNPQKICKSIMFVRTKYEASFFAFDNQISPTFIVPYGQMTRSNLQLRSLINSYKKIYFTRFETQKIITYEDLIELDRNNIDIFVRCDNTSNLDSESLHRFRKYIKTKYPEFYI